MACDLANGRQEPCKDAVAGLEAVYFFNYETDLVVTYDGSNGDVIDSATGVTSLYKFELKGTNSFDQNIVTSRENGTTVYEQNLSLQLKKIDITALKIIKTLAVGRPRAIVKTKNGTFFLAGLLYGLDCTGGTIVNGTAMNDLNGFTLTMQGMENLHANIIDVSTEAALATAFASASIVTS